MPLQEKTASKAAVNLASRSRMRSRNRRPVSSLVRLRASCVSHAPVGCAVTPCAAPSNSGVWRTRGRSAVPPPADHAGRRLAAKQQVNGGVHNFGHPQGRGMLCHSRREHRPGSDPLMGVRGDQPHVARRAFTGQPRGVATTARARRMAALPGGTPAGRDNPAGTVVGVRIGPFADAPMACRRGRGRLGCGPRGADPPGAGLLWQPVILTEPIGGVSAVVLDSCSCCQSGARTRSGSDRAAVCAVGSRRNAWITARAASGPIGGLRMGRSTPAARNSASRSWHRSIGPNRQNESRSRSLSASDPPIRCDSGDAVYRAVLTRPGGVRA
jgi:hypothetical protein